MPNIFNADNGVVSGSAGIKLSSDTSGVLNIQTNGTTAISISASQVVSFPSTTSIGTLYFAAGTAAAPSISVTGDTNTGIYFPAADTIAFTEGGVESARFDSAGNFGLGVTPGTYNSAYRVLNFGPTNNYGVVYGSSNGDGGSNSFGQIGLGNNFYDSPSSKYVGTGAASVYLQSGGRHRWYNAGSGSAGGSISFTEVMLLDSSGNLGLGVTPSAWNSYRALQLGGGGSLVSFGNAAEVWSNAFFNGTNNVYIANGFATRYHANNNGAHAWYNAPSGTAGSNIAFTQAMTLDSSGRLGIGETAPASTVVVRKDATAAVGAELTLLNFAAGGTVGNAAQINFGLENSTYAGDLCNAQIKGIVTNGSNSTDLVYSLYNGSAFAERFRMAATGVFTSTGVSMANASSNATAISVATSTPTIIASVTITTKGKPVFVLGLGDMNPDVGGNWQNYRIYRNGTAIGKSYIGQTAASSYNLPFSVCLIDTPSAGTHTYELRAWQGVGTITYGETGDVQAPTIIAIEVM